MHYCIFIFCVHPLRPHAPRTLHIPSCHTPCALWTFPQGTHPVQAVRLAYPMRLTEHKSFFRCWMKANIRKNSFALSEYSLFAIDKANFVNLYSFFPLTKSYYSAILYK